MNRRTIISTIHTLAFVALLLATLSRPSIAHEPAKPFAIQVVDAENGWPVPLVKLQTVHNVTFVTDNAGRVAFDLPELMGQETALTIEADGYEAPADGFGKRLVRPTPKPGEEFTIRVQRTAIAKRIGRITGAGLFAESQKLGLERNWPESRIVGCDSVQNAVHRGKLFWAWGDTSVARYPLGIFDASSATSGIRPLKQFEPPLKLKLSYFVDENDRPRGVAPMPGDGPTWLSGYVSLPDKAGRYRLVASYVKVKPPLDAYERGLCVWNDETQEFEHFRTLWAKHKSPPEHPPMPLGHAVVVDEEDGTKSVLFGDPLPKLRCQATFEAWQDSSKWETITPQQKSIPAAGEKNEIEPQSGSIAWNDFRKRWVMVFMQTFGKPSAFGEIWYAEADSPTGPWGPAVKILSHKNYTFYNPRLHPEFTPANSPILLFEGTYTTFLTNAHPTPRYDYNQILYRIDLDDPKLAPAQAVDE
jgi:hypothetical protein